MISDSRKQERESFLYFVKFTFLYICHLFMYMPLFNMLFNNNIGSDIFNNENMKNIKKINM